MIYLNMYKILYAACLGAAKLQLDFYQKRVKISRKKLIYDLVSEVDIKSQEIIVSQLKERMEALGYKDIGFVGEENLNISGEHLFIIDPLDGTSSYLAGQESFCISIAYLHSGILQAGMVYQPTKKIIYYAQLGQGAYKIIGKKKTKLKIIEKSISEINVAFNTSADPKVTSLVLEKISTIKSLVKKVEKTSSAVLTISSVATNATQMAVNGRCFLWDLAAVKLIIEESGGKIIDWQGDEINLDLVNTRKSYQIIVKDKKDLQLLLVGSITHSFAKYKDGVKQRYGGGVIYGGKTAVKLGIKTTVLTIGAMDIDPGIKELKSQGIKVYKVSREKSNNFSNDYTGEKRRMFMRSFIDTPIKSTEIKWDLKKHNGVILFPLFNEINLDFLSAFSKSQLLFLDPQGFLKKTGNKNQDGLYPIQKANLENIKSFANKIDILKLSSEDIEGNDEEKIRNLVKMGFPLVILTRGEKSTLLMGKNLPLVEVTTLKVKVLDSAGAGEIFAVAFMYKYFQTYDPVQSVKFANIQTVLKISGN